MLSIGSTRRPDAENLSGSRLVTAAVIMATKSGAEGFAGRISRRHEAVGKGEV
jgi:hypothetical protein